MEVNLLTIGRVRVTMDEATSKQLLAKRLDHFFINLDKSQKTKTTSEGTLGVDVSYFKPRAINAVFSFLLKTHSNELCTDPDKL